MSEMLPSKVAAKRQLRKFAVFFFYKSCLRLEMGKKLNSTYVNSIHIQDFDQFYNRSDLNEVIL